MILWGAVIVSENSLFAVPWAHESTTPAANALEGLAAYPS
jgi:hypothetical protein